MRKRSYVKASSYSSSYYGAKERRGRKAVNTVFAVIALISVCAAVFMLFRFKEIDSQREEAASRLAGTIADTEALNEQRKTQKTEFENLSSEVERLRIEYDSLSE